MALPSLLASTQRSRSPVSRRPTICSEAPRLYTSAVSMKLTPCSRALATMREASLSSVWSANIMVPRHRADTFRLLAPRRRYGMFDSGMAGSCWRGVRECAACTTGRRPPRLALCREPGARLQEARAGRSAAPPPRRHCRRRRSGLSWEARPRCVPTISRAEVFHVCCRPSRRRSCPLAAVRQSCSLRAAARLAGPPRPAGRTGLRQCRRGARAGTRAGGGHPHPPRRDPALPLPRTGGAEGGRGALRGGHGGLRIFPTARWAGAPATSWCVRADFAAAGLGGGGGRRPQRPAVPALPERLPAGCGTRGRRARGDRLREHAKVPVWLVGTSRGTQSVAAIAIRPADGGGPDGIVLTSTILREERGRGAADGTGRAGATGAGGAPQGRGCKLPGGRYRHADGPAHGRAAQGAGGGQRRQQLCDPCEAMAYHGYNGIEPQVVQSIATWITAAR